MSSKAESRRLKKLEYMRQYRIDKAEEISEKRKERIKRECGLEVCKRHLGQHLSNSLHKQELQKRQEILEEKTSPDTAKSILSFL